VRTYPEYICHANTDPNIDTDLNFNTAPYSDADSNANANLNAHVNANADSNANNNADTYPDSYSV
jgi:hypothetical protein